ncbi:MAG TPA: UDP-N-acetylglucosamine 2-epimerase [Gammaproteobacteria bacterium]|nr:UDP-N-acetylglucosamine 2-epimerase [Gammaproteobacteria bacterium]
MVDKKKRKIAVVTGTRADYGLLFCLMHEIQRDPDLTLQVMVTGMHLSPEFGLTYKLIEKDGFNIDAKIEMLLSSDTAVGVAKSIGLGIIGFTDALAKLLPDMVVLLGDRFEALAVAQAALIQRIPLAHIHGGELSEGTLDDAIRHSITKMAHLHFVASEPYRKRVLQLGEDSRRVFNVGAPGLERIAKTKLLSREELEKRIGFKFGKINFLVTYHPATLDIKENVKELQNLFTALDRFSEAKIIFTKANTDEAGKFINFKIDEYVSRHSYRAASFVTLGDLNYLSLLQFVDAVIGNSSSGLIEAPYFKKPTINIGSRQSNRLRASSVIDCLGDTNAIILAIKKCMSNKFKKTLENVVSLYRQDKTSNKIKMIMKKVDLQKLLIKRFNDLI